MNLYVWEDVLTDYTSGMVVVIAKNLQQALETLKNTDETAVYCIRHTPPTQVIPLNRNTPSQAWRVWGGG